MDSVAFAKSVCDWLDSLEPNGVAMCVIALPNFDAAFSFVQQNSGKRRSREPLIDEITRSLIEGGDEFPCWDNGSIPTLTEKEQFAEWQRRRLNWFTGAALIRRATSLAENDASAREFVATIWVRLAEGGKHIAALLNRSILWTDDEKLWFSTIKSERDGAFYVLNILSPPWLRNHSRINAFADDHDFFVF